MTPESAGPIAAGSAVAAFARLRACGRTVTVTDAGPDGRRRRARSHLDQFKRFLKKSVMDSSLIKWVKTFDEAANIDSLGDLADGTIIHRYVGSCNILWMESNLPSPSLLCDIAPDFFQNGTLMQDVSGNSILKVQATNN